VGITGITAGGIATWADNVTTWAGWIVGMGGVSF
jgi:hypothetical protein